MGQMDNEERTMPASDSTDLTTEQSLDLLIGIWEGVRSRIDPSSPDYCRECDYDDHYCPMCGDPTPHGGATPAHQRACWRYEGE